MAVAALLMAGTREALNAFWAYRAVPPHAEALSFKVATFDGTPQGSFAIPGNRGAPSRWKRVACSSATTATTTNMGGW